MSFTTQFDSFQDPATVASGATQAAPAVGDATLGMDFTDVQHYRVLVSAAAGQLLKGAGNMRCWMFSPKLLRWARNPFLDFAITPSGYTWVDVRDIVCAEYDIGVPAGRMLWTRDGVTADAGNIVSTIETWRSLNAGL